MDDRCDWLDVLTYTILFSPSAILGRRFCCVPILQTEQQTQRSEIICLSTHDRYVRLLELLKPASLPLLLPFSHGSLSRYVKGVNSGGCQDLLKKTDSVQTLEPLVQMKLKSSGSHPQRELTSERKPRAPLGLRTRPIHVVAAHQALLH